jgi:tripartite ATP-independent transporter DctM subunit
MLGLLVIGVMTGFPIALAVGSIGMFFGLATRGMTSLEVVYSMLFSHVHSYTLLAMPMFIYMGSILETSGLADDMYRALFLMFGRVRGGLAASTVAVGAVVAASVGVISASVSMLTLVALPAMIKRGYSKSLAAGTTCASGTLGILIPPSIMLVVLGPLTGLSVGRLFASAFIPGFILAALYSAYVLVRCAVQPAAGPPASAEDRGMSGAAKVGLLLRSLVPPVLVILAVLGSILLGVASPTEAAAFGGFVTTLMIVAYKRFSYSAISKALNDTMRVTGMGLLIAVLSVAFTSIFLLLGGGQAVADVVVAAPGGRWGGFALIMFIVFILGMFMDWMGIVFIIVPILLPAIEVLQFDLLWAVMMVVLMLQTGFLSPPFATAIFLLRGAADPSLGVEYGDIIKGVYPFIGMVTLLLILCALVPDIILWLPRVTFGGG